MSCRPTNYIAWSVPLLVLSLVGPACSSDSVCPESTLGCACGLDGVCEEGLVCIEELCLRADAVDAAVDGGGLGDAGGGQRVPVRDRDGGDGVDNTGAADAGAGPGGSDAAVDDGSSAECGDTIVEGAEACDDGTNDGSYGGCEPGCASRAAYCGDGVTQVLEGESCDGDCPLTCEPTDGCDSAQWSGAADACTLECTHTAAGSCSDGDGCCPASCHTGNDDDCEPVTVNVSLCVRNDNTVVVTPEEITAPYDSYLRIHWTNVCNREVWVVNFGTGVSMTWNQLDVLAPGESSSPDVGVAEGPWCAWGASEYRLGGLNYPADDRAFLLVHCVR